MNSVYNGERSEKLYIPPGYGIGSYILREIELDNILDQIWGSNFPLRIKETPHFKYLTGDEQPLRDYFLSCRGHTWARKGTPAENMTVDDLLQEYHEIIESKYQYLAPPYESHYIIVRSDWHCIDGLRRACILLSNGITRAPVAWIP